MENSEELLKTQQDVLTEMGRNLYNLQLVERLLKKIVASSSIEVRKKDNGEFETKNIITNRMMLGKLAERFISDIAVIATDSETESTYEVENKSIELSIKTNFHIELIDTQEHEHLKSTIDKLVCDRNALVHQFHELHSVNSIESCQQALAYLKNKNIFIKAQYEYFKNIANSINDLMKATAENMNSDEFEKLLFSNDDNKNRENIN